MKEIWENIGLYALEAYNLDNQCKKSCIVIDDLEGNHSGYIQQKLIEYYETVYSKSLFKSNLNEEEKLERKKYIHNEVQILLQIAISKIIEILSIKDYYQSELSKAVGLKYLKDNDWIIRTIMEMCVKQGIVSKYFTKNRKYYKLLENKKYKPLQYFERLHKLSKNESLIKSFLDENNIFYYREYSFKDLKDKRYLRFDFYIPKYNTLIEYDGQQHYKNITRFHKSLEDFEKQIHRDELKNEYAKKHNFNLIRIKYCDDVRNILENVILPICK